MAWKAQSINENY